jgi:FkbM family methyltransferase
MRDKIAFTRNLIRMSIAHRGNEGRRATAICRMFWWQAWKRLIGRPINMKVFDGMTFRAYPDSTEAGRFMYFGSLYDYEEMRFMERYLGRGDGFIDGGAHEGSFTLLAGKLVGPTGRVEAFEPSPIFVKRLRNNVMANRLSNVVIHTLAISSEPGVLPFALKGNASHLVMKGHEIHASANKQIEVGVVRLDDKLPQRPWALGKLDVEGAELRALMGAEKLVQAGNPPAWIIELMDGCQSRFGQSVMQVREWLQDHRYDVLLYEPGPDVLIPAPHPLPYPRYNVLAVSRERRSEVESRLVEANRMRAARAVRA